MPRVDVPDHRDMSLEPAATGAMVTAHQCHGLFGASKSSSGSLGRKMALCVARPGRDRVVRGGVALECGPGPIQVGMILHEVEAAVPPVPDTAVPKRDRRSAGAAAYELYDNRERPVIQLLDILDFYCRIGERLKPAGEKALQALMALEDGHIGGSERRHVPHGVFVEELQQPVEAALVPVLEPAARQICVRGPLHPLSLGASGDAGKPATVSRSDEAAAASILV